MNNFTTATTTKFHELTLLENELILKFAKNRERTISFSELDNIYIKSYKLNPLIQFILILFPFLFVPLAVDYLPFDMVIFLALFIIIPVFIKVNNYKWYRLKIVLKDGTFFTKKVSVNVRSENISTINMVKKEWFIHNAKQMASAS